MKKKLKYLQRHNRTHACDFVIAVIVLHPQSRGRLKIQTRNPLAHPSIDISYIDDESDVDILVEGGRRAVVVRHIEIQRTLLVPLIQVFKFILTEQEADIIYSPTQKLF